MARRNTSQSFDRDARQETSPEYHRRIQDAMDADSWVGRDSVGCDFPDPAKIVEIGPPDQPPIIFKHGK